MQVVNLLLPKWNLPHEVKRGIDSKTRLEVYLVVLPRFDISSRNYYSFNGYLLLSSYTTGLRQNYHLSISLHLAPNASNLNIPGVKLMDKR